MRNVMKYVAVIGLVASMALGAVGCGQKSDAAPEVASTVATEASVETASTENTENTTTVVDANGNKKTVKAAPKVSTSTAEYTPAEICVMLYDIARDNYDSSVDVDVVYLEDSDTFSLTIASEDAMDEVYMAMNGSSKYQRDWNTMTEGLRSLSQSMTNVVRSIDGYEDSNGAVSFLNAYNTDNTLYTAVDGITVYDVMDE